MLGIAILVPVIVVIVLAYAVLVLMRRTNEKRLISTRTKHDPDTYYACDELLRATSAGDSTLRVSLTQTPKLL